jgi:hypothetical protein
MPASIYEKEIISASFAKMCAGISFLSFTTTRKGIIANAEQKKYTGRLHV